MIATVKYWAAGVAVAVVVSVSGAGAESWPCGSSGNQPLTLARALAPTDLTCTKTDRTLTVSGTGGMADYMCATETCTPWGQVDSIVIGSGVTSIGIGAFSGISSLKSVDVSAVSPPAVNVSVFNMTPINTAVLRVPQGSIDAYRAKDVWKNFGYINPSTVTFNYAQNDVTPTTQLVSYGDTINEPTDPVRDGFVFEYWYLDAPPSNPFLGVMPSAWDFSTVVQSDMTLIAKWTSSTSVLVKNSPNTANIAVRQTGRELKISTPNRAAARYGVELYSVSGKRQRVSPVYHTDGAITVVLPHVAAGSYILRVGDGKSGMERRVLVR